MWSPVGKTSYRSNNYIQLNHFHDATKNSQQKHLNLSKNEL